MRRHYNIYYGSKQVYVSSLLLSTNKTKEMELINLGIMLFTYSLSWNSAESSLTILKANFALNFSGVAVSTPFEINRKLFSLI